MQPSSLRLKSREVHSEQRLRRQRDFAEFQRLRVQPLFLLALRKSDDCSTDFCGLVAQSLFLDMACTGKSICRVLVPEKQTKKVIEEIWSGVRLYDLIQTN